MKGISYISQPALLAISAAALLLIAGFMQANYHRYSKANEDNMASEAALTIAEALGELKDAGNGSYMIVDLPERMAGQPYKVSLSAGSRIWLDTRLDGVKILEEERPYPEVVFSIEGRTVKRKLPYFGMPLEGEVRGGKVKLYVIEADGEKTARLGE